MQARETPDFWGLHKNRNCVFPLHKVIHQIDRKSTVVSYVSSNKFCDKMSVGVCLNTGNTSSNRFYFTVIGTFKTPY